MSANQTLYNQQCTNLEHKASITNYCACIDCLRPLCPECIQDHYQYHISAKTPAAIQSILNTRTNCERKIAKAIEQLRKEYEQYDIQYIFNPDEILTQEISRMNEVKLQMFEIINIFFKQQENLLENKVKENQLKVRNIGGIFQKIESVIQQLELLRNSLLTSSDPFTHFHKACRLDVKSLLDRYKSDLKKSIKSKELDPINVHIDEHKLFNLKTELNKIVIIQTVDHEDANENLSVLSKNNKDQSINYSVHGLYGQQANTVQNEPMHFQQKQTNQQMYNPGDLDDPLYGTLANYDFSIVRPNYFAGQSAFLHFFINKAKIMKICNLETKQWLTRQIDYQVPGFHKSIVAPNGDIYISGGVINSKDNRKDPIVRKYTLDGRIQQIGQLTLPRSSHSMVYCNQAIYILCGFDEHSNITSSMEKYSSINVLINIIPFNWLYNINTQKMEQCAPCNKPANQPACCTFNDRYIYKFGGNDDNGQILLIIERYDTFTNKWEYINPEIDPLESSKFQTTFQSASCVQINQNNIFVFGGYDNEDRGVHFSFLLNFEQDIHKIRQVDTRPLLYPEGFWNNQVIIHDHKMFVLQNIEIEANHIDENNRCLLCFDGYRWSELQYQNSI